MWIRTLAGALLIAMHSCSPASQELSASTTPADRAILQLGRPICGDCCVEQVKRAFDGMEGVGALDMSPGDVDFSVEIQPGGPSREQLVAALVAAGARDARVSPNAPSDREKKVWVVAR